ncbi:MULTISPECIES: sensor domain-containing diguanylate cyclase [unclassified Butyrivibrio]|uniref:sensor domain-containing diguanylate cyclase n=1 Tax=unclassified Butyrivibrio TaxID=2639466 RepID=UPI0003B3DAF2|nr:MULTISPECIES: sensor domain-containing diguanylate cyclase [unclassified Butyrivibrio]
MNSDKSDQSALFNRTLDITQDLYNKMSTAEAEGGWNDHFGLFSIFAELGRTLVEADRCSFWKWDKINHKLITNAAVGTDQIIIDENTGLVGRAIREKKPIVTNDPYNCPDFNSSVDKSTGYTTKSILVIPCFNCKGEMIGAYQAINKLDDKGFDLEHDVRRLSLAAVVCGITLEADTFLDDSQTDKLTKLRNRMGLHSDYKSKYLKLMQRSDDDKVTVSVIMCDIDHFKRVNDTYGHNAGDAVLEHVAKNLRESVRESDTVYRWGGEEFIIFLAKADLDQSAFVAERIRKRIEASVCTFEGTDIKITMSFGCAEMDPAVPVEDNIKVADTRLYIAKETGRNQVIKETIEGYEKVDS